MDRARGSLPVPDTRSNHLGLYLLGGFVLVGLVSIGVSFFSLARIEPELESFSGLHAPALRSIQEIDSQAAEAIQEAFAYVVSGHVEEKEDFEQWTERFRADADEFAAVLRALGESRDTERRAFAEILSLQREVVNGAQAMFTEYEGEQRVSLPTFDTFEHAVDGLCIALERLVGLQIANAEHASASSSKVMRDTRLVILGSSWLTMLAALAIGILVYRLTERFATQNERVVEALRESELEFRDLYENAPEIYVILDAGTHTIAQCNRALLDALAQPEAALLGLQVYDLFTAGCREDVRRMLETLNERGEARASGLEVRCRDDSIFFVDIQITAIRDAEGAVLFSRSIWRDVTVQLEMERGAERRTRQSMEIERLESLGILARGIAHDFNNLLVGVVGNAELALAREPACRQEIEGIQAAGHRGAELVRQILTYAGGGGVATTRVELPLLVQETVQLFRSGHAYGMTLELEESGENLWVHADATQLRQVVMNLITNALEATTAPQGLIRVCTGRITADRETLASCHLGESAREGEFAFVEVADGGAGMEPETIERIFEPYFTTKHDGRGLGLAGVLHIVRAHEGALRVSSVPEKGTSFRVLLPLESQGESTPVARPASRTSRTHNGRVLAVDDDPLVSRVSKEMLESLGFEVVSAGGGREAVSLFEARPDAFDLVLLDLKMPDLSGAETLKRLREIRPALNVLLYSGRGVEELGSLLEQSSTTGFLPKPFTRSDLAEKIDELLSTAKQSR